MVPQPLQWVPAAHFSARTGTRSCCEALEREDILLLEERGGLGHRPAHIRFRGRLVVELGEKHARERDCALREACGGARRRCATRARSATTGGNTRTLLTKLELSALARPPILCALLVLQCGCVSAIDVLPLPSPGPGV